MWWRPKQRTRFWQASENEAIPGVEEGTSATASEVKMNEARGRSRRVRLERARLPAFVVDGDDPDTSRELTHPSKPQLPYAGIVYPNGYRTGRDLIRTGSLALSALLLRACARVHGTVV